MHWIAICKWKQRQTSAMRLLLLLVFPRITAQNSSSGNQLQLAHLFPLASECLFNFNGSFMIHGSLMIHAFESRIHWRDYNQSQIMIIIITNWIWDKGTQFITRIKGSDEICAGIRSRRLQSDDQF